jgi:hypothetical protein
MDVADGHPASNVLQPIRNPKIDAKPTPTNI